MLHSDSYNACFPSVTEWPLTLFQVLQNDVLLLIKASPIHLPLSQQQTVFCHQFLYLSFKWICKNQKFVILLSRLVFSWMLILLSWINALRVQLDIVSLSYEFNQFHFLCVFSKQHKCKKKEVAFSAKLVVGMCTTSVHFPTRKRHFIFLDLSRFGKTLFNY